LRKQKPGQLKSPIIKDPFESESLHKEIPEFSVGLRQLTLLNLWTLNYMLECETMRSLILMRDLGPLTAMDPHPVNMPSTGVFPIMYRLRGQITRNIRATSCCNNQEDALVIYLLVPTTRSLDQWIRPDSTAAMMKMTRLRVRRVLMLIVDPTQQSFIGYREGPTRNSHKCLFISLAFIKQLPSLVEKLDVPTKGSMDISCRQNWYGTSNQLILTKVL
jgi:hypothetical protein